MNNVKQPYKVFLVNVAIALLLSIIFFLSTGSKEILGIAFIFGICCLVLSIFNFILGIAGNIAHNSKWGNSFLISGAFLLLLSGISCGGGAALS